MTTRRTSERVTLSGIRETYFSGDFEACLTMCDVFALRDAKDSAEIVLLRARCLVQLRRGDHALEALRGLRLSDDQHDEYLTGRMLMSAAYVVLGSVDHGLQIAREAYNNINDAHATVRAEVTLTLAIAHYRKGEYGQAIRLLDAVPEADDIVFIRALQIRGAISWANADFARSLATFHDALA
jgi:tetratricopeptide (TPR) repeat protein